MGGTKGGSPVRTAACTASRGRAGIACAKACWSGSAGRPATGRTPPRRSARSTACRRTTPGQRSRSELKPSGSWSGAPPPTASGSARRPGPPTRSHGACSTSRNAWPRPSSSGSSRSNGNRPGRRVHCAHCELIGDSQLIGAAMGATVIQSELQPTELGSLKKPRAPPGGCGGASERAQGGRFLGLRLGHRCTRGHQAQTSETKFLEEFFRDSRDEAEGAPWSFPRGPVVATMEAMEAAFFDLDKTIISKSSSLALTRPLYRAGLVSRSQLLRGAYAQLVYLLMGADEKRMDRAKEAMMALSTGWEQTAVEEIVRDVLINLIDPYVYQEALDLIALHKALGREVYVVSSSPEEVVKPLAEHFGVAGVIATRAEIVDGKYTGQLERYAYAEGKADAIGELADQRGLDLSASFAYSDSFTDMPMLEAVGNPVAVNPDRDLRREAEKREWQIRYFRRPVRLRSRLVHAVPQPTMPVAAVGAIAAAAVVLAWILLRPRRSED